MEIWSAIHCSFSDIYQWFHSFIEAAPNSFISLGRLVVLQWTSWLLFTWMWPTAPRTTRLSSLCLSRSEHQVPQPSGTLQNPAHLNRFITVLAHDPELKCVRACAFQVFLPVNSTSVMFNVTSHSVGQVTTYLLSNSTDLHRWVRDFAEPVRPLPRAPFAPQPLWPLGRPVRISASYNVNNDASRSRYCCHISEKVKLWFLWGGDDWWNATAPTTYLANIIIVVIMKCIHCTYVCVFPF